jgi:ribonuclease P protein component
VFYLSQQLQGKCALTIPKKIYPKRVTRNSVKRKTTHVFKYCFEQSDLQKNIHIVCVLQQPIDNLSFTDLVNEITFILKKIGKEVNKNS